jgi:hypothetical protein
MKRLLLFAIAVVAIFLCVTDPWKEQRKTLRIRQEREEFILKLTKKT